MIQAILLLLFSVNSWSYQECLVNETMEGVKLCIQELVIIRESGKSPVACTTLEEVENGIEEAQAPEKEKNFFSLKSLSQAFKKKGAVCTNFISADGDEGQYGPWGKDVIGYLKEQGSDSIFMSDDLEGMSTGVSACPNWKKMSVQEREHFWVWVMASISHVESTCNPKARNGAGTNGVAVGLLQMDERVSQRKWRGKNCGVSSVKDANENIRCGLDILGELLKGKRGEYKSNGELWGRKTNSYWQHLRSADGGGISALIKQNPYCK